MQRGEQKIPPWGRIPPSKYREKERRIRLLPLLLCALLSIIFIKTGASKYSAGLQQSRITASEIGITPPRRKKQGSSVNPIYGWISLLLGPVVSIIGILAVNKNERSKLNAANKMAQKEMEDQKKQDELDRYKFEKGVRDELREENVALRSDRDKLEARISIIEGKLDEKSKENSEMRATMALLLEQNAEQKIQIQTVTTEKEFVLKENIRLMQVVEENKREIGELRFRLDNVVTQMKSEGAKTNENLNLEVAVVES